MLLKKKNAISCSICLVSLFNNISIFVGYSWVRTHFDVAVEHNAIETPMSNLQRNNSFMESAFVLKHFLIIDIPDIKKNNYEMLIRIPPE